MQVTMSPAQSAVRERFAALLGEADLAASIRRMGERPRTGEPEHEPGLRALVWNALADLGATRLLLPAGYGGEAGGQQAAVVLAELLGGVLYQGPLLDTLTATEALLADPGDGKVLHRIAEGAPVALAVREHGADTLAQPAPFVLAAERLTARRRFVASAADAEYLCVVGSQAGRPACAVTAREDPTVSLRRQQDTGRGELYDVRADRTPVLTSPAGFAEAWPRVLAAARLRQAGYLVGLCQAALDLGARRAADRHQFGRPIGHFQAPAFALAAAATRVEGARWLVRAAAWEADRDADIRLPAAQALAMAADLSRTVVSVVAQVHGAYGLTEQSDSQLFYRRAAVERGWMGSPRALRAEVLPLLLARHRAGAAGADPAPEARVAGG